MRVRCMSRTTRPDRTGVFGSEHRATDDQDAGNTDCPGEPCPAERVTHAVLSRKSGRDRLPIRSPHTIPPVRVLNSNHIPWPKNGPNVGSPPFWPPMWLATLG